MSRIEWTDRTWNPVVGCSPVSPGCAGCYAAGVAHRGLTDAHRGLTIHTPGHGIAWTGEVRCLSGRLDQSLGWRQPQRIFVGSMTDLFHPAVPNGFLAEIFARILLTPQHTYQVLTKRPARLAGLLADPKLGLEVGHIASDLIGDGTLGIDPAAYFDAQRRIDAGGPLLLNLWAGTSIESERFGWRAEHLRAADGPAVRFLSLEPLLGPLPTLPAYLACGCGYDRGDHGHGRPGCDTYRGIDWVIAGGESGPRARPMHPDWVRWIRHCCDRAGVAFFFKQWGEWLPVDLLADDDSDDAEADNAWLRSIVARGGGHQRVGWVNPSGVFSRRDPHDSAAEAVARIGRRWAGRDLDGRTHDAFPDEVGR